MEEEPIILIDDTCKLCNRSVAFISKNASNKHFRFFSVYSDEGRKYLKKYGLPEHYEQSAVLIENNKAFTNSDAILRIFRHMKGIYGLLLWLEFIPRSFRDTIYRIVARYRHHL